MSERSYEEALLRSDNACALAYGMALGAEVADVQERMAMLELTMAKRRRKVARLEAEAARKGAQVAYLEAKLAVLLEEQAADGVDQLGRAARAVLIRRALVEWQEDYGELPSWSAFLERLKTLFEITVEEGLHWMNQAHARSDSGIAARTEPDPNRPEDPGGWRWLVADDFLPPTVLASRILRERAMEVANRE